MVSLCRQKISLSRRRQFKWDLNSVSLPSEAIVMTINHGRVCDRLTGNYVFKNCVRDRKQVFVFSLHTMQYLVII